MLFNSLSFLVFLPLVTITYFLLPFRQRWLQLLIASCIFYMAFIPIYILILTGMILIDYLAGIFIENARGKKRKALLAISIISNVGILVIFKYYNFAASNLSVLVPNIPLLKIILPIGLSFHTFQAMSYTIEVYRGNQKAERHLGIYALYVMFFPQLVAGPIERPQNLLHQFHEKKEFDPGNLTAGLKLILWGLFKKVVIADRIAIATNYVFNDPHSQSSLTLFLAAIFFSFQIYCDFSGYSDIALGSARMLGFRLMKNFDAPYQSASVSEFWKRWHISLSTWFRDYLYISLGGNRVSIPRWCFNLFFVFLVSGLWHGANWTFILWGALHGIYLIGGILTHRITQKINIRLWGDNLKGLRRQIQIVMTFILVSLTWIFFRAANVSDAWYIIKKIVKLDDRRLGMNTMYGLPDTFLGMPLLEFSFTVFLILFLMTADFLIKNNYAGNLFLTGKRKYAVYFLLVFGVVFLGIYKNNRFIYFQF